MEKIFGNGGEWVNFKLAAAAPPSKCLRGVVSTRYSSSSLSFRLAIYSTRYRIASRLYTHHAHAHRMLHALARIALEAHASASFLPWLPVALTCSGIEVKTKRKKGHKNERQGNSARSTCHSSSGAQYSIKMSLSSFLRYRGRPPASSSVAA